MNRRRTRLKINKWINVQTRNIYMNRRRTRLKINK